MVKTTLFGQIDNQNITQFTLTNKHNMQVSIINYGATITSVKVPNQQGELQEITLGYNNLDDYINNNKPYFGAIVGRVAGRIKNAAFTVNNKVYHLSQNHDKDQLHGGSPGLSHVIWKADSFDDDEESGVVMHYVSPEGEAGYPGNVGIVVQYRLTDDNELFIEYYAETDFATPLSLTNHTYWNLAGSTHGDISGHHVEVFADEFLPTDEYSLPTGEIKPVENTKFDFTEPKKLGTYPYDHCFVLGHKPTELILAAIVTEPTTGRKLECYTTQPGLQFYTGKNLEGEVGREGKAYQPFAGLCLETQNWPNAINHAHFPNSLLRPGKEYQHTTCYQFYF